MAESSTYYLVVSIQNSDEVAEFDEHWNAGTLAEHAAQWDTGEERYRDAHAYGDSYTARALENYLLRLDSTSWTESAEDGRPYTFDRGRGGQWWAVYAPADEEWVTERAANR